MGRPYGFVAERGLLRGGMRQCMLVAWAQATRFPIEP
jgi:hypothetical protein